MKPKTTFETAEAWKPIPGYEGLYEVSSIGRVKSLICRTSNDLRPQNKILKDWSDEGYRRVGLYDTNKKAKQITVHLLVLKAFIGPRPTVYHQGAHLNGDRADNRPSNLMWATPYENNQHKKAHGTMACGERAGGAKLTDKDIAEIRQRRDDGETITSISKDFDVSRSQISLAYRGLSWKHLPKVKTSKPTLKVALTRIKNLELRATRLEGLLLNFQAKFGSPTEGEK